jgi:hypothetical protein
VRPSEPRRETETDRVQLNGIYPHGINAAAHAVVCRPSRHRRCFASRLPRPSFLLQAHFRGAASTLLSAGLATSGGAPPWRLPSGGRGAVGLSLARSPSCRVSLPVLSGVLPTPILHLSRRVAHSPLQSRSRRPTRCRTPGRDAVSSTWTPSAVGRRCCQPAHGFLPTLSDYRLSAGSASRWRWATGPTPSAIIVTATSSPPSWRTRRVEAWLRARWAAAAMTREGGADNAALHSAFPQASETGAAAVLCRGVAIIY